jgi:TATA element modulatory factor
MTSTYVSSANSSSSSGNAMSILREKEEQIQQLLDEGEKLSKTQLQHTNIIKLLRNKEKENDQQTKSLKFVNDMSIFDCVLVH